MARPQKAQPAEMQALALLRTGEVAEAHSTSATTCELPDCAGRSRGLVPYSVLELTRKAVRDPDA